MVGKHYTFPSSRANIHLFFTSTPVQNYFNKTFKIPTKQKETKRKTKIKSGYHGCSPSIQWEGKHPDEGSGVLSVCLPLPVGLPPWGITISHEEPQKQMAQLPLSWVYKTRSPNPHPLIPTVPFELLHGKRYMEVPICTPPGQLRPCVGLKKSWQPWWRSAWAESWRKNIGSWLKKGQRIQRERTVHAKAPNLKT